MAFIIILTSSASAPLHLLRNTKKNWSKHYLLHLKSLTQTYDSSVYSFFCSWVLWVSPHIDPLRKLVQAQSVRDLHHNITTWLLGCKGCSLMFVQAIKGKCSLFITWDLFTLQLFPLTLQKTDTMMVIAIRSNNANNTSAQTTKHLKNLQFYRNYPNINHQLFSSEIKSWTPQTVCLKYLMHTKLLTGSL